MLCGKTSTTWPAKRRRKLRSVDSTRISRKTAGKVHILYVTLDYHTVAVIITRLRLCSCQFITGSNCAQIPACGSGTVILVSSVCETLISKSNLPTISVTSASVALHGPLLALLGSYVQIAQNCRKGAFVRYQLLQVAKKSSLAAMHLNCSEGELPVLNIECSVLKKELPNKLRAS